MALTQPQIDASNALLRQGNILGTQASQVSGQTYTPIPLSILNSEAAPAPVTEPPPENPAPASGIDTTIPKLGEKQQGISDLIGSITAIQDELKGQSAFTSGQESAQGIPALEQAQTDIANQILMLQAEEKNAEAEMQKQAEGRGITKAGLEPLTMARKRELGIQANILGAQLAASQNNLALADRRIKRAVQDKFGPLEEKLKAQLANLDTLSKDPALTLEEQKRAEATKLRLEQQQAETAAKKETQTRIWELQTSVASNLANFKPTAQYPTAALALKVISEAKTEQEALRIATETGLTSTAQKETADIAEFKAFFPGVDVGTAEGRQKYLDWKARVAASGRKEDGSGTDFLSALDVARYRELYPDLDISSNDTEATVREKLAASNSPEAKLRNKIVSFKDLNKSYEETIEEIEASESITDKELAKKIAKEVFGITDATTTSQQSAFGKGLGEDLSTAIEGIADLSRGAGESLGAGIDSIYNYLFK